MSNGPNAREEVQVVLDAVINAIGIRDQVHAHSVRYRLSCDNEVEMIDVCVIRVWLDGCIESGCGEQRRWLKVVNEDEGEHGTAERKRKVKWNGGSEGQAPGQFK
eukprot:4152923-Amphidinium_carterae.1